MSSVSLNLLPSGIANAKQQAFIVVDKKTQTLKALCSLGGRLNFWVKTKFSTKNQIAKRNQKVQSAVKEYFEQSKLLSHKELQGLFQKIPTHKPLRVRDLNTVVSSFASKRDVQFPNEVLKKEGVVIMDATDRQKRFDSLKGLKTTLNGCLDTCKEDLKELKGSAPQEVKDAAHNASLSLKVLCSKIREYQYLKLLRHQINGTTPPTGLSAIQGEIDRLKTQIQKTGQDDEGVVERKKLLSTLASEEAKIRPSKEIVKQWKEDMNIVAVQTKWLEDLHWSITFGGEKQDACYGELAKLAGEAVHKGEQTFKNMAVLLET